MNDTRHRVTSRKSFCPKDGDNTNLVSRGATSVVRNAVEERLPFPECAFLKKRVVANWPLVPLNVPTFPFGEAERGDDYDLGITQSVQGIFSPRSYANEE